MSINNDPATQHAASDKTNIAITEPIDILKKALAEISTTAAAAGLARHMDDALDLLQTCGTIADEALENLNRK